MSIERLLADIEHPQPFEWLGFVLSPLALSQDSMQPWFEATVTAWRPGKGFHVSGRFAPVELEWGDTDPHFTYTIYADGYVDPPSFMEV